MFVKKTIILVLVLSLLLLTACMSESTEPIFSETNGNSASDNVDAISVGEMDTVKDNQLVDLTLTDEPFRVTYGMGPEQSTAYSQDTGKQFKFNDGQVITVSVDFISDYVAEHRSDITLTLEFMDGVGNKINEEITDRDSVDIQFTKGGIYNLSIVNQSNTKLWYSFELSLNELIESN